MWWVNLVEIVMFVGVNVQANFKQNRKLPKLIKSASKQCTFCIKTCWLSEIADFSSRHINPYGFEVNFILIRLSPKWYRLNRSFFFYLYVRVFLWVGHVNVDNEQTAMRNKIFSRLSERHLYYIQSHLHWMLFNIFYIKWR